MRLNKFISKSGFGSRREADKLIKGATVTVNGNVELNPAYNVVSGDKVQLDEQQINLQRKKRFIILNKPSGYITTVKDPLNRKTVMDLVDTDERLFPVGRLDKDTTGLLLLTNVGDTANILTHPRNKIERIYKVEIDKIFKDYEIKRMASKIYIGQKEWGKVEVLSQKRDRGRVIVDLRLFQGKKREIRRIMYRMKRKIFSLQRIKFGPIELGDLPIGQWRELNGSENQLLNRIKLLKSKRA